MKIITNPPFKISRKKFAALLNQVDTYVVIHTFRFCNNELKRFELVDYKEWPEVTNIQVAIAASTMEINYIERPMFYKPDIKDCVFEGCEEYFIFYNTHFMDGQYSVSVKQNKPNLAKKLIFKDVTDDAFINKGYNNKFSKVGYIIKRCVYPRSFIKIFEKHLDEIYMDTRLWGNIMTRWPLIRQEFVDEKERER